MKCWTVSRRAGVGEWMCRMRLTCCGMTVLVVDASILVVALLDDERHGRQARRRLSGERLVAPSHIDLEVLSAWRGLARSGTLPSQRLREAVADLRDLPMQRVCVTPYDAAYVALGEAFACPLLTADARLARASTSACPVDVMRFE